MKPTHPTRAALSALLMALFLGLAIVSPLRAGDTSQDVYLIPVYGEVEPGMAAFIERALKEIENTSDSLVIFEINTFGGRVDSALKIVDTLLTVPKGRTIAYVKNKAISAGALIALACKQLVMEPHTTIGDVAPISYSQDGPQVMGEKFQSPLRAKFRTLAKRHGYSETLAEAMVTAEMEVYRVETANRVLYLDAMEYAEFREQNKDADLKKTTVVAKGELLTMDDTEARELGFSKMTVASIAIMLTNMGITDYRIIQIEQSWSEDLGRLIAAYSTVLMMIGLAALYTEMKAPGFGAPGIIGLLCLGLVFFNQYLIGLADHTELILIGMGIILLAIEFFVIPGFGIAGPAGFLAISVGMILSFQDFVIPDRTIPWQGDIFFNNILQVLGSFLGGFILALVVLRYGLPRLAGVVKGPYLETTLKDSHADSLAARKVKVGDTGVAHSFLRPSGKARINNQLHDVISEGEFIDKGTGIMVIEIHGNRIIVSKKSV